MVSAFEGGVGISEVAKGHNKHFKDTLGGVGHRIRATLTVLVVMEGVEHDEVSCWKVERRRWSVERAMKTETG